MVETKIANPSLFIDKFIATEDLSINIFHTDYHLSLSHLQLRVVLSLSFMDACQLPVMTFCVTKYEF